MSLLHKCYKAIRNDIGEPIESFEVAKAVEEVCSYWRPETVLVLLLAESRVFTSDQELAVHIDTHTLGLPLFYPSQFVNQVHLEMEYFWKQEFYQCCTCLLSYQKNSGVLATITQYMTKLRRLGRLMM